MLKIATQFLNCSLYCIQDSSVENLNEWAKSMIKRKR